MAEENIHIVHKVTWNTRCDDESLARNFQNNISNWTNSNLPTLLEEILDEIVPEKEWHYIDKLEIDVGAFVDNLKENDLTNKVKIELKKQLLLSLEGNTHKIKPKVDMTNEGLFIKNAGLVLISSYFPMLFEKLQLTSGSNFISTEAEQSAAYYLQYVATGMSQTEEHNLVLNKILCGIRPEAPISNGKDISDSEVSIITGMIEAIINHWPSIGESSVDGFRGNWLMRDGILREESSKWTLTVETKTYDMLMDRAPFSFSIINFSWMKKSLHVVWR